MEESINSRIDGGEKEVSERFHVQEAEMGEGVYSKHLGELIQNKEEYLGISMCIYKNYI